MRIIWRLISVILKLVWRILNFARELVLNIVFIFFLVVGILVWTQFISSDSSNTPPQRGALLVNINGTIVDNVSQSNKFNTISRRLLGANADRLQQNSLFEIVNAIRQAKTDSNITGMILDLEKFTGTDLASLQYIGKVLQEFRDAGKPIFAISNNYSQSQYYLASFANKIWMSPQGRIDLHGFATNGLYYKSLLDKLKVTSHIFRVGTYKSAVEPFIRDDMSPEAREANSRWISEFWQNYLKTIATNRKISVTQVFPGAQRMIDDLKQVAGDTGQYALHRKLVDALMSAPQIEKTLSKQFGRDKSDSFINATSIYDYSLTPQPQTGAAVAVLFASGTIIDGKSSQDYIGSDSLAEQIRAIRLDPSIKAVVLRVNSPGGSVYASEAIREQLEAVKQAGKPIVVSMGGLAASGGYWISSQANYIVASPNTLTGSIGVFGVINTVENSLDSIGVHTDGVATSPLALASVTGGITPEIQQMMQLSVESSYQGFINLVAKSRNKTPQQIDQIAQGRVWSGLDAKNNGLVDQLGDFDDAVNKAAELIKTKQWHLVFYQQEPSLLDKFFDTLSNSAYAMIPAALQSYLPASLTQTAQAVKMHSEQFVMFTDPGHRYAFCLTCGDIR